MLTSFLKKYGLVAILVCMFMAFALSFNSFFTTTNVTNIFVQASVYILMGIGLTVVMMAGEIDLSFSASIPFTNTILVLSLNRGLGLWSVGLVVLIHICFGLLNALLVVKLRLSSFITTLATMFFVSGLNYALFGGKSYWLRNLRIKEILDSSPLFIPNSVIFALAVSCLMIFFSLKTTHGIRLRASGENPDAARASGVQVTAYRCSAFVVAGILYALASVLQTSRLSGALGPAAGGEILLPVMAIAFLGQTTYMAGRANVVGALIAGIFMATMNNALILSGIVFYAVPIIQGLVLVVAIVAASIGDRSLKQIKF